MRAGTLEHRNWQVRSGEIWPAAHIPDGMPPPAVVKRLINGYLDNMVGVDGQVADRFLPVEMAGPGDGRRVARGCG